MKFVYFAWVRETIGVREEEHAIPEGVETVSQMLQWFSTLSERHAVALSQKGLVRVALDHEHADDDALIAGVSEVALFPPMTGG